MPIKKCADSLLVEEWLKQKDFVTRLHETHKCTQTTFIRASGNDDFSIRVELLPEKGRVGICYCFLQSWSSLSGNR